MSHVACCWDAEADSHICMYLHIHSVVKYVTCCIAAGMLRLIVWKGGVSACWHCVI